MRKILNMLYSGKIDKTGCLVSWSHCVTRSSSFTALVLRDIIIFFGHGGVAEACVGSSFIGDISIFSKESASEDQRSIHTTS